MFMEYIDISVFLFIFGGYTSIERKYRRFIKVFRTRMIYVYGIHRYISIFIYFLGIHFDRKKVS